MSNHSQCPVKNGLPDDFIFPNTPSKCKWTVNGTNTPHSTAPFCYERKLTYNNILETLGNTPLVKLNRIPKSLGIECDMYAKCEFLNAGGSVKDRIGLRMIEDAERANRLNPDSTIIEPSSGNTGIGLAVACAVKGYKCLIVMPEKMSNEKVDTLRALGAKIVRTPTEASFDSNEGLIAVAQRLQKEIPNSIVLDQYKNPGNPLAHYDGTATEIIHQLGGNVDMVVLSAGTAGTITGIGKKIKEKCPKCIVVGADPEGSVLARPEPLNESDTQFYEVEGIGYDFIPTVMDHSVVDIWGKTNDAESLPLARRLINEEGLLIGGSSGAALAVALKEAKKLKAGQKCVVLLPDSIRNYMTKFASDNWMEARNFKESVNVNNHWWWNVPVSNLKISLTASVEPQMTCKDAIKIMNKSKLDQIAVINKGKIEGVLSLDAVMNKLFNLNNPTTITVGQVMSTKFIGVDDSTNLGRLSRIIEKQPFVVYSGKASNGLITKIDLLHYIAENEDNSVNLNLKQANIC